MAQMLVEGGHPESNLSRAVSRIWEAAEKNCRLVVLPECLDLGWTDPSARRLAEPIPGAYFDRLADAAQKRAIYVVAGLVERCGDRLYNAAVLIGPDGKVICYYYIVRSMSLKLLTTCIRLVTT